MAFDNQIAGTDSLAGSMIGSYVVQRLIGEGRMGSVWEIIHPEIGRRLALKVLHPEFVRHEDTVSRFVDEGKAVCRIGHPNIVDVFDFGRLPDGRPYLIMEFLEGESLSELLRRENHLPPEEIRAIVLPICSALGAAHQAGIVHRDLKPGNIFLARRPDNPRFVKVLDFGIAKLDVAADVAAGGRTRSGMVLGTPTYMSPEQAAGRNNLIDLRSDVYALSVMVFQMLTGKVPFQAEAFGDLMLMHMTAPRPRPSAVRPGIPPAWDDLVVTGMATEREGRFPSMQAYAAAIDATCRDSVPTWAPPVATPARRAVIPVSPPRKMPSPVLVVAAGILAVAGLGLALHRRAGRRDVAIPDHAMAALDAPGQLEAVANPPVFANTSCAGMIGRRLVGGRRLDVEPCCAEIVVSSDGVVHSVRYEKTGWPMRPRDQNTGMYKDALPSPLLR